MRASRVLPRSVFGRHVGDGADGAACAGEMVFGEPASGVGGGVTGGRRAGNGGLGKTEVENFCVAARGDENIGGLDVAMNDAFGVSGVEGVGNVSADFEKALDFDGRVGDDVLERGAFHVFHDDEDAAVVFLDVVDGADVRMVEGGGGASFSLEALEGLWILGDVVGKKFQGYETAEFGVFGFVNDTHSAAAEFFDDAVIGDGLADEGGGIGHGRGDSIWRCTGSQTFEDRFRMTERFAIGSVLRSFAA